MPDMVDLHFVDPPSPQTVCHAGPDGIPVPPPDNAGTPGTVRRPDLPRRRE